MTSQATDGQNAAMPRTVGMATDPDFQLHTLGWKAFQNLCVTVMSEVLGHTFQAFIPTKDGGRDGAFHGRWTVSKGQGVHGSFVVQCKYSNQPAAKLRLSDFIDETRKALNLARQGLADNYVFMTNLALSAVEEKEIRSALESIPGIQAVFIFGKEWITARILESAKLRIYVPRIYGLGDLSQILDERAIDQAQEIITSLGDDLKKFVVTGAHTKSARALQEKGFVLLLGEPASGKSMIAASLAVAAIDIWESHPIKIRSAREFAQHWNPNEPRRFFWVDDAFGPTQYQRDLADEWNQYFLELHAAIRKGARAVFTSRDYIWRAAMMDLKLTAFPLLQDSQVIIDVEDLSHAEREEILYNHIKLGTQDRSFKARVKPFLPSIVEHRRFLPELCRRLGDKLFTENLKLTKEGVLDFIANPRRLLIDVIRSVGKDGLAALSVVFMRGGRFEILSEIRSNEETALHRLGSTSPGAREYMNALEGSLLRRVKEKGESYWQFRHPTIRDAMAAIVAEKPDLLDIYLLGAMAEQIMEEVYCGDVQIEGAKVFVPVSQYNVLVARLNSVPSVDSVLSFLVNRGDQEIITMYLSEHEEIVGSVLSQNANTINTTKVRFLLRLQKERLLGDEQTEKLVEVIKEKATSFDPEPTLVREAFDQKSFSEEQEQRLRSSIIGAFVVNIDAHIDDWQDAMIEPEPSPEERLEPLRDALRDYASVFARDLAAQSAISRAINKVDKAVKRMNEDYRSPRDDDDDYDSIGGQTRLEVTEQERSVFDDVDS